ncbi:GHKL domain-containing protein [Anaerocolumna sedimenticola]|uniref:GHKL domain-containing protein n=1 Tax=Anaerocolumna sedimenticola TaxID=2696063 RepID=A0A6P1TJZ3_9FIRM|nr:ATP-binding protein [Anaerocolumna sedimenticola]QHQ61520.1 GHKL domain-containing protein [Anaerocolumna sedimenticola]
MLIIASISIIAYNLTCLLYFKRHFQSKRKHWIYYAIAVTINLACSSAMDRLNLHQLGVIVIMASFMLELKLLFQMDILRILHGASAYIIVFYSSRGMIVSLFSIFQQESINGVLNLDHYYYMIAAIAGLIGVFFVLLVRRVIAPDTKTEPLFPHTKALRSIVYYQFAIVVYMLQLNEGRFLDINALWFSLHYLASCAITLALLAFIWNTIVQVTGLLEYELNTKRLQEQLECQISHYNSYKKFTESYRIFRHDYGNVMSAVKILIKNNENEKAIKLLDEIHDTMQKNVLMHKTYSNNVLLDAILQDSANTCEEHNIRFDATLHLFESLILSDLDIIRICTNILNNAIEACEKIPQTSDRFIKVTGSTNPDWSFIEIANSFNGQLEYQDGELVSTKKEKDFHGYGLTIIRKTIEDTGGMVLIDADQEKKIFSLKLHIPRNQQLRNPS